MKKYLMKVHEFIVNLMAKSWVVENLLIAKISEEEYDENGENPEIVTYDCIYCTILRVSVIFLITGFILGYFYAT